MKRRSITKRNRLKRDETQKKRNKVFGTLNAIALGFSIFINVLLLLNVIKFFKKK